MHHHLGVGAGDRLLDVACGAGLAVELAALRGAHCAGIDASPRLLAVAQDRSPDADLRVGDMNALPWKDSSFDVVTSFRGIWGTTPSAVAEAIPRPGPWGTGRSDGVGPHQGIPRSVGVGAVHSRFRGEGPEPGGDGRSRKAGRRRGVPFGGGFTEIERVDIPCVWEFSDPETYARALASTGPAFEAIQAVGEESFLQCSRAGATTGPRRASRSVLPLPSSATSPRRPARGISDSSDGETPSVQSLPVFRWPLAPPGGDPATVRR